MTKEQIGQLLCQIKIMYPRFDSVDKTDGRLTIIPAVVEAWHNRIGWMDYDRAIHILDRHMESEDGGRTPTLALWMNNGKAQKRAEGYESTFFDRQHGVIRWQPEPDGVVFERPVTWNGRRGCYEDEDGYMWASVGEV